MESGELPFALIANKLRSIPLVTARLSREELTIGRQQRESTSSEKAQAETAAANSTKANAMVPSQVVSSQAARQQQIGKRDASPLQQKLGERIQNQAEILFQRNGITASTAKIMRRTSTTSTTTTRRPKTATTTRHQAPTSTTPRPQRRTPTSRWPEAKLMRLEGGTQRPMAQSANKRQLEPLMSYRASSFRALATTTGDFKERQIEPSESTAGAQQSQTTTTTAANSLQQLTRATQAQVASTLPVNQRRQQQPVLNLGSAGGAPSPSARATSSGRLANRHSLDSLRGAGENWTLFNRPDDQLSVFESLVLVANVLIVGTVIFVILFNFIKTIRRRRNRAAARDHQTAPSNQTDVEMAQAPTSAKQVVGSSDAMSYSRISMLSSNVASPTSGTMGARVASQPIGVASEASAALDQKQAEAQLSSFNVMSNNRQEIKTTSQNSTTQVASTLKATAIVQPSAEGQRHQQQQSAANKGLADGLKEELKEHLLSATNRSPISRSVSDISRASSNNGTNNKKLTKDDSTPVSEHDRVAALEELFNSGKGDKLKKGASSSNEETAKLKSKEASSESLESIELPSNLVEPPPGAKRKLTAKEAPEELLGAPSPNVLLGQVETVAPVVGAVERAKAVEAQQKEEKKVNNKSVAAAVSPDQRPENPMGRDQQPSPKAEAKQQPQSQQQQQPKPKLQEVKRDLAQEKAEASVQKAAPEQSKAQAAEVKNHQVVVNKLDKRKTNLEIVDLRDESVTGKMRSVKQMDTSKGGDEQQNQFELQQQMDGWISMDGVAVVQAAPPQPGAMQPGSASNSSPSPATLGCGQPVGATVSPSEIIESRFRVDYAAGSAKKRRSALVGATGGAPTSADSRATNKAANSQDSVDSKQEEYAFNNIDNELEQDNRMRNRKYFVYIVRDGQFTARKECIARIELPPKRRITLAELRELISSSQDISLASLRRNRFKFVTETYRLLNENEDAAVLHQVYPTQGVFLKLNVTDTQDNLAYNYKGSRPSGRLSSGGLTGGTCGGSDTHGQATIASRRRANARAGGRKLNTTSGMDGGNVLPAIEVDGHAGGATYRRSKSSLQARRRPNGVGRQAALRRGVSSSSVHETPADSGGGGGGETLPPIGKSTRLGASRRTATPSGRQTARLAASKQTLGGAASDLGANVLSGAKKLFNFSSKK